MRQCEKFLKNFPTPRSYQDPQPIDFGNINQYLFTRDTFQQEKNYLQKRTVNKKNYLLIAALQGVVFGSCGRFERYSLKPVLRWGIGRKSNFFTVKARKLKLGNRINVDVQISNLKLVSKNSFQLSWKRGYNGKKKVFLGRVNIFSHYRDLALLTCILKGICWSMQRS